MDHRNVKLNFRNFPLRKSDQFRPNLLLIQESILISKRRGFHLDSRSLVDLVVIVELIFVEKLVDCLTSVAAEGKVFPGKRMLSTIGSTMHTDIVFPFIHDI
jgi:hypothetical protein